MPPKKRAKINLSQLKLSIGNSGGLVLSSSLQSIPSEGDSPPVDPHKTKDASVHRRGTLGSWCEFSLPKWHAKHGLSTTMVFITNCANRVRVLVAPCQAVLACSLALLLYTGTRPDKLRYCSMNTHQASMVMYQEQQSRLAHHPTIDRAIECTNSREEAFSECLPEPTLFIYYHHTTQWDC